MCLLPSMPGTATTVSPFRGPSKSGGGESSPELYGGSSNKSGDSARAGDGGSAAGCSGGSARGDARASSSLPAPLGEPSPDAVVWGGGEGVRAADGDVAAGASPPSADATSSSTGRGAIVSTACRRSHNGLLGPDLMSTPSTSMTWVRAVARQPSDRAAAKAIAHTCPRVAGLGMWVATSEPPKRTVTARFLTRVRPSEEMVSSSEGPSDGALPSPLLYAAAYAASTSSSTSAPESATLHRGERSLAGDTVSASLAFRTTCRGRRGATGFSAGG